MIACNDLSIANHSLALWRKRRNDRRGKVRAWGACLYFVRMGFGHLYEALKIIQAIAEDPQLMEVVETCDRRTQASFKELLSYIRGNRQDVLTKFTGGVRHNVTFHYDASGKLVSRAINALAKQGRHSSITRADSASGWHFAIADLVVDEVVCHQIWKIPTSPEELKDANSIVDDIHKLFLTFMGFSGGFIWRYCSR